MMTTASQPTQTALPAWIDTLAGLIDDLRRLDLKIDNDTRLEPAATGDRDQVDTGLVSRTRIMSQGRLVAEFEFTGRIRLWHQWPPLELAPTAEEPAGQVVAPDVLVPQPGVHS